MHVKAGVAIKPSGDRGMLIEPGPCAKTCTAVLTSSPESTGADRNPAETGST